MNVLVVGGAGYIGSHCVRQLQAAGHRPVVLDNLVHGHRAAVPAGVSLHEGNLGDRAFVGRVLRDERIEVVMHFAAYCYVGESVTDPLKYYFNNVVATLGLLRTMHVHGVKKFVFSSTCATYGDQDGVLLDENSVQRPINAYGASKRAIEDMLNNFSASHGLNRVIFRYFNVAGADSDGDVGEQHIPETHLIPLMLDAIDGKRAALTVFGSDYPTPDGTCIRDYVHVADLCEAHWLALQSLAQGEGSQAYNLGNGDGFSVFEVIDTVRKVTGREFTVKHETRRAGDPSRLVADSSAARQKLGWVPKYPSMQTIVEHAWAFEQRR